MQTFRLALFASGGGSTVEAILSAINNGTLHGIEPALVITSDAKAGVIHVAKKAGISQKDIVLVERRAFKNEASFGEEIIRHCIGRRADIIGQYGWLLKTPKNVVERFSRMINQHPGALDQHHATESEPHPDFGGPGMWGRRVIASHLYFHQMTGENGWIEATSQVVYPEYDAGPTIQARPVAIRPNDTVETLRERLLPVEHAVQIATLAHIAFAGRIVSQPRPDRLVNPRSYRDLREAKKRAIADYPKG